MNTINQRWQELIHQLRIQFKKSKLPDLNAVLFLIGVREFGKLKKRYSKEEKEDLMHIAVCRVLSESGYYELEGLDQDGWPHWKIIKPVPKMPTEEQEQLLKEHVLHYFENL